MLPALLLLTLALIPSSASHVAPLRVSKASSVSRPALDALPIARRRRSSNALLVAAEDGWRSDGGRTAGERDDSLLAVPSRHLICLFGALTSLVAVKATVAQALPLALLQTLGSADEAARVLGSVCAASAALEFALLPIVAALSDTIGRRTLLLTLPALTVLLRLLVVWHLCPATLIASRMIVGVLVNHFFLFVGVCSADRFGHDSTAVASLEGKRAAAWGAAYAAGMQFTLHPSPFTLHPSPSTLHPSPFTQACSSAAVCSQGGASLPPTACRRRSPLRPSSSRSVSTRRCPPHAAAPSRSGPRPPR